MSDTYKVRMMVLVMVPAVDAWDAEHVARDIAADAGLDVLHVEDPEVVPTNYPHGSLEGDIYP